MASAEVKARIKAAKVKHELHVNLLMVRLGLSKADAVVMAYLDGLVTLDAIMPTTQHAAAAKG